MEVTALEFGKHKRHRSQDKKSVRARVCIRVVYRYYVRFPVGDY